MAGSNPFVENVSASKHMGYETLQGIGLRRVQLPERSIKALSTDTESNFSIVS